MEEDTERNPDGNTPKHRRTQNSPSAQTNKHCTTRLLLGMTLFFSLTTVGIVVVLLWRELIYHHSAGTLKEKVLKKFPGYFRTQDVQETIVTSLINLDISEPIHVNQTFNGVRYQSCSINCAAYTQNSRRKKETHAPGSIFHGCCVSNTYFASPDTKVNIFGSSKTLAHYADKRQYFQAKNCSYIKSCTGCTCVQDRSVQTAVVLKAGVTSPDDIEDFEIDFFFIDGCCTCRNT
ncbi:hypothetical protein CHS0354_008851 [Potamilus streckersoni]|uniref:Uncharacterized protein n=1 Tax=Potamilus streckersoni TaxID=2493646 RepID=A0AAE0VZ19_9BIVA|nr:hypothetical protein CHS0354_008851 [Potamilus streckersoni]